MKKILLIILLTVHAIYAQGARSSPFKKNSWEISGAISGGRSTSLTVYDGSNSSQGIQSYSYYGTHYTWYADLSPVISYFVIENLHIYLSPTLNISQTNGSYSPLNPDNPSPGPIYMSTYVSDVTVNFYPFIGAGYVFRISDKLFLGTSFDIQRTKYSLRTGPASLFGDDTYSSPSLTRFNFRVTPKLMIGEKIFLNFSLIAYYETDRLMTSAFKQKGFATKLDAVSATFSIGLSYLLD